MDDMCLVYEFGILFLLDLLEQKSFFSRGASLLFMLLASQVLFVVVICSCTPLSVWQYFNIYHLKKKEKNLDV